MEAAGMDNSEFDPEMMEPEELMAFMGEKAENIQQMLKESLVDANFYNGFVLL